MKKLFLLIACASCVVYAAGMDNMNMPGMSMESSSPSNNMMDMSGAMYFDFGLGYGTASNWASGSLALDAMTMGFYFNKYVGTEVGMGMLTSGTYQDSQAMINDFHLAVKGVLPLNDYISVYGKLGLGVITGMAMPMMVMYTPANPGLYYGGGLQFNIAQHAAIYLEDSGIATNANGFGTVNQTTLGVEFKM